MMMIVLGPVTAVHTARFIDLVVRRWRLLGQSPCRPLTGSESARLMIVGLLSRHCHGDDFRRLPTSPDGKGTTGPRSAL